MTTVLVWYAMVRLVQTVVCDDFNPNQPWTPDDPPRCHAIVMTEDVAVVAESEEACRLAVNSIWRSGLVVNSDPQFNSVPCQPVTLGVPG